ALVVRRCPRRRPSQPAGDRGGWDRLRPADHHGRRHDGGPTDRGAAPGLRAGPRHPESDPGPLHGVRPLHRPGRHRLGAGVLVASAGVL
ncbi:MAG: hypothetical protein AVDCRST_MAG33-765, partial [uncultured Thermomicrobiales bacterium]